MRKLTFEVPELRQLEINGHVFDIQKADMDVLEKAAELQNKYADLSSPSKNKNVKMETIVAAVKSIIGYIDEMLGEGAA